MKRTLYLLFFLFAVAELQAKVLLSSIFGDNMVLQQKTYVLIHGTATIGKVVKIDVPWDRTPFTAQVGQDGRWCAKVRTPDAGGPYTITISDGDPVTLSNVLIGEVWLCSGQSNMEMIMRGYESQPAEHAAERIVAARTSKPIRICTVPHVSSSFPKESADIKWLEHTPEVVASTSATAYFFAETLQNALDVPVGIVVDCWGGSTIETWMTKECIEKVAPGEFDFSHLNNSEFKEQWNNQKPQLLYNGKIAPVIPFTVKGFIWYQGESNRGRADQYAKLMPAFVQLMRDKFQSPDAGFYFVQIAPYPYENPDSWVSGYLCEAQEKSLKAIPHSGMATTVDIGEYQTIHPHKKLEVGMRLAWLALSNDYGMTAIDAVAPSYKSMKVEGRQIIVEFDNCGNGLCPLSAEMPGFEIAGEDRVFHKAKAYRAGRSSVRVFSDEVENPVAVRYCFRNFQEGVLANTFGIPAGPFRTDNWNL